MFHGALVALITPFRDGQVDYETLEELVEFQIESGIDGIVPVGTTGESPTLSYDEHKEVIRRIAEIADHRVPVIAGTGSNSTAEAIELTEYAKKAGADASLQVCPYYNKPTQEGFYQHFKTITEEVDLPEPGCRLRRSNVWPNWKTLSPSKRRPVRWILPRKSLNGRN
jgi:4-hydroxy-tetrahydrodipicolinate synthase